MLPCFRCGAPAVGVDGVCANCGTRAYDSPYGMPPGGPHRRREIRGLGLALMIMLGITAALIVGVIAAQAQRHKVVTQLLDSMDGNGTAPSLSSIQSSDDFVQTTAVLLFLCWIATGVLTICWLYAARTNAETYSPYVFRLSRGWAIGGWFIPLAAMVLPLLVALDTHRGTTARRDTRQPSGGAITGVWWGFWLAGSVALGVGFDAGGKKKNDATDSLHDLHGMQTTSSSVQPGFLLLFVAAILMLFYVRKITNIQVARAGEPYGGGMPAPYGTAPNYGLPYGPRWPEAPAQAFGAPPPPFGAPQPPYGAPQPPYGALQPPYGAPQPPYGAVPQQNPYPTPAPPTQTAVPLPPQDAPTGDAFPLPPQDPPRPQ